MKHQKEFKRYCIEQHRKMWHWIAEQYKKRRRVCVRNLKIEYLVRFLPGMRIEANCFCCEYAVNTEIGDCGYCPLIWSGKKEGRCLSGEYDRLQEKSFVFLQTYEQDGTECAELAEQIANLPERMEV